MLKVDCIIPAGEYFESVSSEFLKWGVSGNIIAHEGYIGNSEVLKAACAAVEAPYLFICTKPSSLTLVEYALQRFVTVADATGAAMVYSDRFKKVGESVKPSPVNDYQVGSLRDNFDFGVLILIRKDCLDKAIAEVGDSEYAALYELRLALSRIGKLEHIPEYLYYEIEDDSRKSGEKLFDYVNPANREVQIEMEEVVTRHLKQIGAYLKPSFKHIDLKEGDFEYEVSVVIPCRNRAHTIETAVRSALEQKTDFKYNVIVVDDNSSDGTKEIVRSLAKENSKVILIDQDSSYHGIGGNWNAALHSPKCGRFAIQLDSDDFYCDTLCLQKFVDTFYRENCAMVIGSYSLCDRDFNPLPPGVIDHREWTEENGRNNALRVNGLGAPRGFFTPIAREINFPVVRYGEDYAVALRICREYKIGRIYDVLYSCRRWEGNSDADIDILETNRNDAYKDRIRSYELLSRLAMNACE